MLKSTLSALWLATMAWGKFKQEDDNIKSIGVRELPPVVWSGGDGGADSPFL
jgi:hypothetical protein